MDDWPETILTPHVKKITEGTNSVPLTYENLRESARDQLSEHAFTYADCGAGSGSTVTANQRAFSRYRILPRVLRDVADRSLRSELFGREIAAPLVLAPVGGQMNYHEDGELSTARAATDLGIPFALSTVSSYSIEAVAEAGTGTPAYFQLYWPEDPAVAESLVTRAERAGYDAIVLTVDSQLPKWRPRSFSPEGGGTAEIPYANFESDPVVAKRARAAGEPVGEFVSTEAGVRKNEALTWDDLDILREWTDLPIVLKGILSPDDARRADDWGADGIVVSNHGGRQIDTSVSSLEQLPKIVDVVSEGMTVLFDGGVRGGADVFTALALGADAVQIGRPYIFGLAIAGQGGVREVASNYLAELESVMGLAGYRSVEEIGPAAIVAADES